MPRGAGGHLVEKHVRMWENDRDMKKNAGILKEYSPLITISRQIGSGGVDIAELTAQKLKYKFLDRAIVDSIAERAAIRNSAVETVDERAYGMLEECIRATLMPYDLSRSKYIEHLAAVMTAEAEHGRVVIVGRGANFILRDFKVFRVRIVCPPGVRIERISEKNHISMKEAEELVRKSDTERMAFIRNYYYADIDDANHYDLVLNTEKIIMQQAAEIIVNAFRLAFPEVQ